MGCNKFGGDLNQKPAGNFYLARRAGIKEATLCQRH